MIDGWIRGWELYTDWQFDDLEEAKAFCKKLHEKLDESNKSTGEHYGVIDMEIGREIFCMDGKNWEPPESMYPSDSNKLHFKRSEIIWQAKHVSQLQIFVESLTYKEALPKILKTFKIMGRDVSWGKIQIRRLPIVEVKEETK